MPGPAAAPSLLCAESMPSCGGRAACSASGLTWDAWAVLEVPEPRVETTLWRAEAAAACWEELS